MTRGAIMIVVVGIVWSYSINQVTVATANLNGDEQASLQGNNLQDELSAEMHFNNETGKLLVTVQLAQTSNSSSFSMYSMHLLAQPIEQSVRASTQRDTEDTEQLPDRCSEDFIDHSSWDISVGCPAKNPANLCIPAEATNFTVEFRDVYSSYYCLIITPYIGSSTRKPFCKIFEYFTERQPTGIAWNTTIDLRFVQEKKSIVATFTTPSEKHEFGDHIRVELWRVVSGSNCSNPHDIQNTSTQIISLSRNTTTVEVEFHEQPSGFYCLVVTPTDERCGNNGVWTTHYHLCSRHSPRAEYLGAHNLTGVETNTFVYFRGDPALKIDTFILILTMATIATMVVFVAVFAMVGRQKVYSLIPGFCKNLEEIEKGKRVDNEVKKTLLVPKIQIFLLYCRDDPKVCVRVAELRKQLESKFGHNVIDYDDEAHWEQIAEEGIIWLYRWIHSVHDSPSDAAGHCNHCVILVESKDVLLYQRNSCHGMSTVDESVELKEITDREFLYGLQLLNSVSIGQVPYRNVLRVRFLGDQLPEELNASIVTPFTVFYLPGHFDHLVQHILTGL